MKKLLLSLFAFAGLAFLTQAQQTTVIQEDIQSNGTETVFTQTFSISDDTGQMVVGFFSIRGAQNSSIMIDTVLELESRTAAIRFPATEGQKVLVTSCFGDDCFEDYLWGDNSGEPEVFSMGYLGSSTYDTTYIRMEYYQGLSSGLPQLKGFVANAFEYEDLGWAAEHKFDLSNASLRFDSDTSVIVAIPNSFLERGTGHKFIGILENSFGGDTTPPLWFQPEAYVGIDETLSKEVAAFKNAAGLHVTVPATMVGQDIMLSNVLGQSLFVRTIASPEMTFDIGNAAGCHFLTIGNGTVTKKLSF